MRKFITLVLSLALCLPMFLATNIEVKAEGSYDCAHANMGCTRKVVYEGSICTECNQAVWENTYTYMPAEGVDAARHEIEFTCSACPNSRYDGSDSCFDSDYDNDSVCDYCFDGGEPVIPCSHMSYECRNNSVEGSYMCSECTETITYELVEVDSEHPIEKYHKLIVLCDECGVIYSCPGEHWNKSNGRCACGYYVGFSNGSCGDSVSSNAAPKEEPKYEAPSADEIMQMEIEEVTQAAEAVVRAEVEMPVTDFISTEAVNALPAEVKDTTGDAAVYNLSKITTTRGFVAAVTKMVETNNNSAQKSKTVTFYSSTPFAFNTSSLTALADTATEFVYMFEYEGHLYKITIPAGAKVDLEGQMFAGPLYIGSKLGTSVLVK